jgi:hypothetical protein
VVERWNRTIKDRMWRYFTHMNTKRYIDVLQDIIASYNSSWHSSIKATPESVTVDNEDEVRSVLYPYQSVATKYRFSPGQQVRISKTKLHFEKGYVGNWSEEIFVIHEVKKRHRPVYKLKDLQGTAIEGVFYEPELQRVRKRTKEDLFVIEKVIQTKGAGRAKKHLVKWRGEVIRIHSTAGFRQATLSRYNVHHSTIKRFNRGPSREQCQFVHCQASGSARVWPRVASGACRNTFSAIVWFVKTRSAVSIQAPDSTPAPCAASSDVTSTNTTYTAARHQHSSEGSVAPSFSEGTDKRARPNVARQATKRRS